MATSGLQVYDVVADFGAIPGINCSANFQAAINAAQANPSSEVFVPGGGFIAENLNWTSQFGGFRGTGSGATGIRTATPNANLLNITNTFLAEVSGMVLGGVGNTIQTGGSLINCNGSHHGIYRDLELVDMNVGISLVNSTNCEVSGLKAFQCYGEAYIYTGNGGGSTVKDCQLDISTLNLPSQWNASGPAILMPSVWAAGLSIPQGKVIIANNAYFIAGNAGTSVTAPVRTTFGAPCMDGAIAWYYLCQTYFHQIWHDVGSVENWIGGNDMDGPSAGPVRLDGWGNSVIDNKITNGLRSGIDMYGASHHNIISLNLIDGFPLCGVQENSPSCVGNIITPNHVLNCRGGAVVTAGSGGIYGPNVTI